MKISPTERFLSKVRESDGHWLWTRPLNPNGYGYFYLDGRPMTAHRAAHILFKGPIPAGLHIDHVKALGCGIKQCVNPAHLEAVTPGENFRRGDGGRAVAESNRRRGLARTHCPHGHGLSGGNVYLETKKNGNVMRRCRACRKAQRG